MSLISKFHKNSPIRWDTIVSDALGSASYVIGSNAQALAAQLKHKLGATYQKISDFFAGAFEFLSQPSTWVRAGSRLAEKLENPSVGLRLGDLRPAGSEFPGVGGSGAAQSGSHHGAAQHATRLRVIRWGFQSLLRAQSTPRYPVTGYRQLLKMSGSARQIRFPEA